MIDPENPFDIGRGVVNISGERPRFGTITNWTVDWVHVRHQGENFSRPCAREDLEWEDEFRARYR